MTKRDLTPDEARAWARVVKSVKPIGDRKITFDLPTETANEVPKHLPTKEWDVPPPERPRKAAAPKEMTPRARTPANRGKEKKVRRGQTTISATLDLHGHTQTTAASALERFLTRQRGEGARCVLVITGKGKLGEGVLRKRFMDWITSANAGKIVSGYAQAHQRHGGSGAFYVFIRRSAKH